jgi:hypothetical protein
MLLLTTAVVSKSGIDDRWLAESLANEATRKAAIVSIAASGSAKLPLLLTWTTKPPRHVEGCAFLDGLIEALGELRAKEAVPFLVKNISFSRSCGVNLAPWLKVPAVIEWNLPSVGALVKIGPEASRAVMSAFDQMRTEEDRRAAVFVVSRIPDVPEARAFLEAVRDRADRERFWAEQGINRLSSENSAAK